MKRILLVAIVLSFSFTSRATVHVVTTSGLSFMPPSITILAGDTVDFTGIGSNHSVIEVSQTTWNANMNTPLAGGFSFPLGGGTLFTSTLSQGMHWYVCGPHASSGMKATINVVGTVGIASITPSAGQIATAPNPFSSSLTVVAPGLDGFRVFDMAGREVLSAAMEEGQNTYVLDAARLNRGVYVFRFYRDATLVDARKLVRF